MMRVGYLTAQQFAEIIAPSINDVVSTSFQPLDDTLTALAGLSWTAGSQVPTFTAADTVSFRSIGVAAGTDVLDRDAGDGRYALLAHTHVIADITGLQAELDAKQPLDADLTTLAANITAFGHNLVNDVDASAARTTLGLGTAAVQNIGTSGTAVPLLDGAILTWSGQANFTGGMNIRAATPISTLIDSDTAGTGARGYFQLRDSANVQSWRIGKVSSNNLEIDNLTGDSIFFARNGSTKVTIDGLNNRLDLASGMVLRVNSLQVVGPRITGWAAASGTATRTTFDTATVTTTQLAERVKALIDDLRTHGLINT